MQSAAKPLNHSQAEATTGGRSESTLGLAALALIVVAVIGYLLLSSGGGSEAVYVDSGGFASKDEQAAALAEGFTTPTSWEVKKKLDHAMAAHKAALDQRDFARRNAELQASGARDMMELRLTMQPAPAGKPKEVATAVLADNVDSVACPGVKAAKRKPDGTIVATCGNGDKYLVFSTEEDGGTAMNCAVVTKLSTVTC